MKKKIVVLVSLLVIILLGFILFFVFNNRYTKDEVKFNQEYKLNNKDNNVKYLKVSEVINKLQKGSSIIYFGFPECPWCQNLVPVLISVNNEYKDNTLYYYNALDIRDKKHLDDDGNIVVDKEGTKEYKKIVEILSDHLGAYEGLNDESIKRLYFPTVVFVSDGEVVDVHIGTIDSQTNPKKKLTSSQKDELTEILEKKFDKVLTEACEKEENC